MPTIQIIHDIVSDEVCLHTSSDITKIRWDYSIHGTRQLTVFVSESTLRILNDNKNQDWENQCREILNQHNSIQWKIAYMLRCLDEITPKQAW